MKSTRPSSGARTEPIAGQNGQRRARFARAGALALIGALATLGLAVNAGPASAVLPLPPFGAVYTQTNGVPNAVQIFTRSLTGALTPAGSVATGGNGDPGPVPPYAPQGAVHLHKSGRVLFAVNEGSGTVTSFRVTHDFGLQFASQVSSLGALPASVTSSGSVVYVLNGGSGDISGYTVDLTTGVLTPIPASTVSLASPAAPAQISFDTSGRTLAGCSAHDRAWVPADR